MKNAFYFIVKTFFVLRYLNFCLDFLVLYKKTLDQKYKVNFEIYVATRLTMNYNTHIAQYTYLTQSKGNQDNETGSVNRI